VSDKSDNRNVSDKSDRNDHRNDNKDYHKNDHKDYHRNGHKNDGIDQNIKENDVISHNNVATLRARIREYMNVYLDCFTSFKHRLDKYWANVNESTYLNANYLLYGMNLIVEDYLKKEGLLEKSQTLINPPEYSLYVSLCSLFSINGLKMFPYVPDQLRRGLKKVLHETIQRGLKGIKDQDDVISRNRAEINRIEESMSKNVNVKGNMRKEVSVNMKGNMEKNMRKKVSVIKRENESTSSDAMVQGNSQQFFKSLNEPGYEPGSDNGDDISLDDNIHSSPTASPTAPNEIAIKNAKTNKNYLRRHLYNSMYLANYNLLDDEMKMRKIYTFYDHKGIESWMSILHSYFRRKLCDTRAEVKGRTYPFINPKFNRDRIRNYLVLSKKEHQDYRDKCEREAVGLIIEAMEKFRRMKYKLLTKLEDLEDLGEGKSKLEGKRLEELKERKNELEGKNIPSTSPQPSHPSLQQPGPSPVYQPPCLSLKERKLEMKKLYWNLVEDLTLTHYAMGLCAGNFNARLTLESFLLETLTIYWRILQEENEKGKSKSSKNEMKSKSSKNEMKSKSEMKKENGKRECGKRELKGDPDNQDNDNDGEWQVSHKKNLRTNKEFNNGVSVSASFYKSNEPKMEPEDYFTALESLLTKKELISDHLLTKKEPISDHLKTDK